MATEKELVQELVKRNQLPPHQEMSFWLDSYDDLFSDFDPRPYDQKGFSVDFLDELRRVVQKFSIEPFTFRLLVPKDKRKSTDENIIKKRLRSHAKKHFLELKKKQKQIKLKGILLTIGGMMLMGLATFISLLNHSGVILFSIMRVVLEPAGWFAVWFGLDIIFYEHRTKKQDYDFYHKLTKADLQFKDI